MAVVFVDQLVMDSVRDAIAESPVNQRIGKYLLFFYSTNVSLACIIFPYNILVGSETETCPF